MKGEIGETMRRETKGEEKGAENDIFLVEKGKKCRIRKEKGGRTGKDRTL